MSSRRRVRRLPTRWRALLAGRRAARRRPARARRAPLRELARGRGDTGRAPDPRDVRAGPGGRVAAAVRRLRDQAARGARADGPHRAAPRAAGRPAGVDPGGPQPAWRRRPKPAAASSRPRSSSTTARSARTATARWRCASPSPRAAPPTRPQPPARSRPTSRRTRRSPERRPGIRRSCPPMTRCTGGSRRTGSASPVPPGRCTSATGRRRPPTRRSATSRSPRRTRTPVPLTPASGLLPAPVGAAGTAGSTGTPQAGAVSAGAHRPPPAPLPPGAYAHGDGGAPVAARGCLRRAGHPRPEPTGGGSCRTREAGTAPAGAQGYAEPVRGHHGAVLQLHLDRPLHQQGRRAAG